jgi:hypothetical protein
MFQIKRDTIIPLTEREYWRICPITQIDSPPAFPEWLKVLSALRCERYNLILPKNLLLHTLEMIEIGLTPYLDSSRIIEVETDRAGTLYLNLSTSFTSIKQVSSVTLFYFPDCEIAEDALGQYVIHTGINPRQTIAAIAADIKSNWKTIPTHVLPLLDVMSLLNTTDVRAMHGLTSGREVINRFLAESDQWKGRVAKETRLLLRSMIA